MTCNQEKVALLNLINAFDEHLQMVECRDGSGQILLGDIQLFDVTSDFFDLT